jgi:hypothetical protein
MKKIIFIIATVVIIGAGVGGYFIFKKPATAPVGKCGDSICDEFEKANPSACPADCAGKNTENGKTYQCPQYTPPAPSFYENCRNQGGTVTSSGKNDKGCQSPPQCVLPETSRKKDIKIRL